MKKNRLLILTAMLILTAVIAFVGINIVFVKGEEGKEEHVNFHNIETTSSSAKSELPNPAACQNAINESQLWEEQSDMAGEGRSNMPLEEDSIKWITDMERANDMIPPLAEALSWKTAAIATNQAICKWGIGSIITLSARNDQKELFITHVICSDTAIISYIQSDGLTAVGYYTTGKENGLWHYIENPSGVTDASLLNIKCLAADSLTYTAPEIIMNELLHCKITSLNKMEDAYIATATYAYPETGSNSEDEVQYKIRINAESSGIESISYIQTGSKQQPVKEGIYMVLLPEDTSYYSRLIDVYGKIRTSDTALAYSLGEIMNTVLEP